MGYESTDRPFASLERKASGNHEFDLPCQDLEIGHRLIPPRSSQTIGMDL